MSRRVNGKIGRGFKTARRWLLLAAMLTLLTGALNPVYGQQFNSDNWWLLPYGVGMGVATVGEHYSTMYLAFGFWPKWEVDISTTLLEKEDETTANHYATSAFVKRLLYENETQTGGLAVMAGIGSTPGYLQAGGGVTSDFKSYWAYIPWTVPLFDNTLSWDIMPGATYNLEYGPEKDAAWGFLYSSRIAIYKVIPQSAIVAEVFGTEGDAYSKPQYKAGVRWEGKYVVAALTYGAALDGSQGSGIELGVMVLTPPFLCKGGCK